MKLWHSLLIFLCFTGFWANSAPDPLYKVETSIEMEAPTLAQSEKEAQQKTLFEALSILWTRLGVSQPPTLTPAEQSALILHQEVADEKYINNTYKATHTYFFSPPAVRAILNKKNIPVTDIAFPKTLVLPIFKGPKGPILFGEDNPYISSLAPYMKTVSGYNLLLPLGDLEDMETLSAEQALTKDLSALQTLMHKYDADDVALISFEPIGSTLRIKIYPYLFSDTLQRIALEMSADQLDYQSLLDMIPQSLRRVISNRDFGTALLVTCPTPSIDAYKACSERGKGLTLVSQSIHFSTWKIEDGASPRHILNQLTPGCALCKVHEGKR